MASAPRSEKQNVPVSFHPAVQCWFATRFGEPTAAQDAAWPSIHARRHTLIAAPTGSGKTLAAFLAAIDGLVRQGLAGDLADETQVVYVSPLKALSNDIHRNLLEPLREIRGELEGAGLDGIEIRTLVRTGDTPAGERTAMTRKPPHILVTTPESLFILLTSEGGRRMLRTARTAIVDEIHAVAGTKRGSHLALTLERLEALAGGDLLRIGLSATQRPVDEVARFLVGSRRVPSSAVPECSIVDVGHRRDLDLGLEVPRSPLEAVMSHEVWGEVYDRLAELIREHRTTLIFVNTRRLAERVTRHLSERLGADRVASHHGSLSRERRLESERRLKAGELPALVATASMELGIDIGSVDLVCQIGSTRSISTLLQRVGRSGHALGRVPKGRIFPTSRDELVEAAALLDALGRGELERLEIPTAPLDILAQQIVAAAACEEWREDDLFRLARGAWPYRDLAREDFDAVLNMLSQGFHTRRGRAGALVHHDRVHGRLRARRGARLAAITSGGAIPDSADYHVVLQPSGILLGSVNEDFALESQAGDIFQLGNASWRILKLEQGRLLVEDARGAVPSVPFWLGEAPGRSPELSAALARFRGEVAAILAAAGEEHGVAAVARWLREERGLSEAAAAQIAEYLAAGRAALQAMPTQDTLVVERFFDEAGDMHVVLHAPFGSRINRAWGLALRKRFCRTFNFELQAAATEDAILLSLGPTHSFPLEDVMGFLRAATLREVLTQALLDAPMFPVRWRWNAARALAILRFRGGRRVPPRLLRMQAEDLVSLVFPDQLACLENIAGDREIPEHPLVKETIRDCLEEAMDIDRLEALLSSIERGEKTLVFRDRIEPSPFALEVLGAKPYAFLDDAPLEERRVQAVQARRWLDPRDAAALGALDAQAIERVRAEAWPDPRDADELHDALVLLGFVSADEAGRGGWDGLLVDLVANRSASRLGGLWVAAERIPELRMILPAAALTPHIEPPPRPADRAFTSAEALVEILRGRLAGLGPTTAARLAEPLALSPAAVEAALIALEGEGTVLRGRFTPGAVEIEWCERRLLARIHRATLDRLRREIEPVAQADFMRFLLAWQRVDAQERVAGPEALVLLLEQLEGYEAPAAAWEEEILPARMADYDPLWLDAACQSGRFLWCRVRVPAAASAGRTGPVRTTPIAILRRDGAAAYQAPPSDETFQEVLTAAGRAVLEHLRRHGASFFAEIVEGSGLLRSQVEEALGELVASGLATADSFTGLRALLTPSSRRPPSAGTRRRHSVAVFGMESAGRWSLLGSRAAASATGSEERVEALARTLLRRYGVVFRRVIERESLMPLWRELVRVYRRLEARGEIRGGRFVDGVSGEQYALPEAVARMRSERRRAPAGALVSVSAADPLNLAGVVVAGERVSALIGNRILFRDGAPLAVREGGKTRFLATLDPATEWAARNTLLRRRVPARLKAYVGR